MRVCVCVLCVREAWRSCGGGRVKTIEERWEYDGGEEMKRAMGRIEQTTRKGASTLYLRRTTSLYPHHTGHCCHSLPPSFELICHLRN